MKAPRLTELVQGHAAQAGGGAGACSQAQAASAPFPSCTGHRPRGRAQLFCRKMSSFCSRKGLPGRRADTGTARMLT